MKQGAANVPSGSLRLTLHLRTSHMFSRTLGWSSICGYITIARLGIVTFAARELLPKTPFIQGSGNFCVDPLKTIHIELLIKQIIELTVLTLW